MPDSKSADAGRRLYLIDAMALAYRSHFIFISRPLINSKGKNTSATYGFTNALIKLIEDHGMDHMAVVFDAEDGEGTFRDDLYDAYKAHRDPMPDDLRDNLPYIKQVVEALDIPVIVRSGVEADDVIGTLARCCRGLMGRRSSSSRRTKTFSNSSRSASRSSGRRTAARNSIRSRSRSFREKFGLEPLQFIDILALMGDASDNVPGCPGNRRENGRQADSGVWHVENAARARGGCERQTRARRSGESRQ
jgi:DNA polymerase I